MVRQAGRDVPDTDDEGPPDAGWHTPRLQPRLRGRGTRGERGRCQVPGRGPAAAGPRGCRLTQARAGQAGGPDTQPPPRSAAWPTATAPHGRAGGRRAGDDCVPLRSRVPARLRAVTSFLWESTRAQIEKEMKETTAKLLPYGGRGSHDARVLPAQTAPRRVGGRGGHRGRDGLRRSRGWRSLL